MLLKTGLMIVIIICSKHCQDKKDRMQVKEENKFVGFDAYKHAIALADVVILATPPGFRPIHFEEAINNNKQVFMEKPVATDPNGIQRVLAAAEKAKQKKLNVVVGLQRRYQTSYRDLIKRVEDGAIGDITSAQAWWNNDGVWVIHANRIKLKWNIKCATGIILYGFAEIILLNNTFIILM